jgi:protocatechuate 3,4-dioxygenase beta subunit
MLTRMRLTATVAHPPTKDDSMPGAPTHDHDLGLTHDLPRLLGRRRALGLLGAGGLTAVLAACASDGSAPEGASSTAATAAAAADCAAIPEETAGPFPGDGSNGPNVLTESGVVRSDITTSFGPLSGAAEGTPLDIQLTVLETANGCRPYEGAAVYVWHTDRDGGYSLYSDGITDQNYLRGVQAADGSGLVTFTSIFPSAYSGRWPHIHFEVYESLDAATQASAKLATSQIALPEDICAEVYQLTAGYEQSVSNLARVSLDTDNVFSDGYSREMGSMSGNLGDGLTVALTVPV